MFAYEPEQLGFSDFLVQIEFPREPLASDSHTRFEVPASLLTRHSPVFASMVEGAWRESFERRVTVLQFLSHDFGAFLRCMALAAVPEELAEVWGTPLMARMVLPIAAYYQVEPVIRFFEASVGRILKSGVPDCAGRAADLALSIEESMPCGEKFEWDKEVLAAISARLIRIHRRGAWDPKTRVRPSAHGGGTRLTTCITYAEDNDCIDRMTPHTLRRCLETLHVDLEHRLNIAYTADILEDAELIFK